MTKNKQYAILHIESGEYLRTTHLTMGYNFREPYFAINLLPKTESVYGTAYITYSASFFKKEYGISRRDFSLKSSGIYFRDKIFAITFLRDIYLPHVIELYKSYNLYSIIPLNNRIPERIEFEIVEV